MSLAPQAGATERLLDSLDDHGPDREAPIRLLLQRAVRRARGSLLWERLWPALATLLTALGLFLAFSWAGLWIALPPLGRAIGLGLFVLLALLAVLPLTWLKLPSIPDGLRRLDRSSGERHRPATAILDRIAANSHDPVAQALWRAHVERALMSARRFKAGWPSPQLALRDPIALRALVLMLVVTTFFAAGGEHYKRVAAAFDWHGVMTPANFRIDAWVDSAGLYRPAAGDAARLAPRRDRAGRAAGGSAGRQRAGGALDRRRELRHRTPRRSRTGQGRCEAAARPRQRGAPLRDQGRRFRHRARRRRRPCLALHRHSRSRADHRARQGSRAAGARLAQARLQDGRRLRRGRRARPVSSSPTTRTPRNPASRRIRCSARRISASTCRRRAPVRAPGKPSTISPSMPGPAPRR